MNALLYIANERTVYLYENIIKFYSNYAQDFTDKKLTI